MKVGGLGEKKKWNEWENGNGKERILKEDWR